MYTGIVQDTVIIDDILPYAGGLAFALRLPEALLGDLAIGASVSIEGVCTTVTAIDGARVTVDAIDATLARTNLRRFSPGDAINFERSARHDVEFGGHPMAGHVSGTAKVVEIDTDSARNFIRLAAPPEWARYIFPRGFLGVNGASLTVAEAGADGFLINLIPETLRRTTFRGYRAGDEVNFEVDQQTMVTVDTLERCLENILPRLLGAPVAAQPH